MSPKDIISIKRVVDFLNKEFPPDTDRDSATYKKKKFIAFFPRLKTPKRWHILCYDFPTYYSSKKFKVFKDMMEKNYPDLMMEMVWKIGIHGALKDREGVIIG